MRLKISILILIIFSWTTVYSADLIVKKGITSQLIDIFIYDASSGAGAGLTGLAYNTSGLACYYHRDTASSAVAITLVSMTLGTWSAPGGTSWGFIVVDATNMPGWYQLSVPDAALATGATSTSIHCKGATNMVSLLFVVNLVDNVDADTYTLANSTGVKLSPGTGTGQISLSSGAVLLQPIQTGVTIPTVTTLTNDPTGVDNIEAKLPTNYIMGSSVQTAKDDEIDAIKTKTDFLPSATAGTAGGVFIAGTNAATTITTGLTTTFTGNLTGSVGSVTGLTVSNLDVAISSRSTLSVTDNIGINLDDTTGTLDAAEIGTDAITAVKIAAGAIGTSEIGSTAGTVTTGSCDPNTTLTFDTTMTEAGVNHWKDVFLTFKDDTTTAELRGQTKAITASTVNGCITVKGGFTTTPQSGDGFVIINK